ncbi:hypothetical protein HDU85_007221 [Gaertneriomyces sp. JEL0708]|nr:hypothetical protein HDU85_007221 [Gaertneriomyces sp. JEL0708]
MKYISTVAAYLALIALSSPAILTADAATHSVRVAAGKKQVYEPSVLNIAVGDVVAFTWEGGPHTVTQVGEGADECKAISTMDSGSRAPGGEAYALKFNTPGTRAFACTIGQHCANGMKMKINVGGAGDGGAGQAPPPATPPPAAPGGGNTDGTTPAAPTTPNAAAKTHTVAVGPGTLVFQPAALTIAPGDTVRWEFKGTHNVKQVSAAESCDPLAQGFQSANLLEGGVYERTFNQANDTGTLFYVCTFNQHCAKGMKGSITVDANAAAAGNTGGNGAVQPGSLAAKMFAGAAAGVGGILMAL